MSKPLSLFSDQVLAAARAPASVKAPESGEFDHLNPDGSKKHKQLALQKRRDEVRAKNAPDEEIGTDEDLITAKDICKALFVANQALIQAKPVAKNQKPTQDAPAVEAKKKSKQPKPRNFGYDPDTEDRNAASKNGGIHL
ncbi:MAG: hypothetical protein O2962_07015 [Cyanobacteria bacterium]|nr:hypothetical protein [Cyanobacteriota bacterium]